MKFGMPTHICHPDACLNLAMPPRLTLYRPRPTCRRAAVVVRKWGGTALSTSLKQDKASASDGHFLLEFGPARLTCCSEQGDGHVHICRSDESEHAEQCGLSTSSCLSAAPSTAILQYAFRRLRKKNHSHEYPLSRLWHAVSFQTGQCRWQPDGCRLRDSLDVARRTLLTFPPTNALRATRVSFFSLPSTAVQTDNVDNGRKKEITERCMLIDARFPGQSDPLSEHR
jgi:hypothetical protein